QEAASPAAGVGDPLARPRLGDIDHCLDQGPRREVLAGAGLCVGGILLQEALIGVALDIGVDASPSLRFDQIDDEATQLGGILDPARRFRWRSASSRVELPSECCPENAALH